MCSLAGNVTAKKLNLRLVIGACWCFVAFVLLTAYNSVLTSFVSAPHVQPLVETAEDVAQKSHVNPVTIKNKGVDIMITVILLCHRICMKIYQLVSQRKLFFLH